MVKKHMKQLAAPKSWPVERKGSKFVTRPESGAHSLEDGVPLTLALTNLTKTAKTTKEANGILYKKEVLVDGIRRKNPKFIVGFMDTISFPETKETFRVFISRKGKLVAQKIDEKEAGIKIVKILNKKTIGKEKVQLNLGTGRNIIVKKDEYKVGDSIVLELPKQNIKSHIKLEKGTVVMLTSNKHMGLTGTVSEVTDKGLLITSDDLTLNADKNTVIAIGKNKSEITLLEK